MTNHAELAKQLFFKGYNCAQSVFCAFTDVTGYDIDTSARMASSFGAGLGRLRETCGVVSAAALVLAFQLSSITLMLIAAVVSLTLFLIKGSNGKAGAAK